MLNGLFPNALHTIHQGQDGGRGLSPRLWTNVDGQALSPDGLSNMLFLGDDFCNFGAIAPAIAGTTAGAAHGGYAYYVDTATSACSITQLAIKNGIVRFSNGDTDNHESWLTAGGNTGAPFVVSDTAGDDKLLIFETRFRLGQVSDSYNVFIGLAEEGLAAANTVTDAGALADKDLLGFWILEGDGDALKFGYRKAGGAVQTVGTYGTALVASTWYKAGLVYNPRAVAGKRIKFYIDNVEQTSYVTATNIAAATFPDAEELTFLAGIKNGAAAAKTLDLDWYNVAQAG